MGDHQVVARVGRVDGKRVRSPSYRPLGRAPTTPHPPHTSPSRQLTLSSVASITLQARELKRERLERAKVCMERREKRNTQIVLRSDYLTQVRCDQ